MPAKWLGAAKPYTPVVTVRNECDPPIIEPGVVKPKVGGQGATPSSGLKGVGQTEREGPRSHSRNRMKRESEAGMTAEAAQQPGKLGDDTP